MKTVLVVYWSMSGNTELMAKKISEGADADLFTIDEISPEEALKYDKIAFGCPSMGDEFEEGEEFYQWYQNLEYQLDGKKIAIFGSYGWGSGEWMEDWEERLEEAGYDLFEEALMVNEAPGPQEEEDCFNFGKRFKDY
ncbi:MAG: flavodoxin [Acholeplasmataceae bacterium]|jgi:flavodoxin short chain|nr:flavodoxin [Acholeplasmataceae bacterium]MCK9234292.1 flavodoxin [Acholeplasmataceae bacterium]MCK9289334.1 flavodoxin [Acholeplasmataceae bacterium]MCK9427797.1 flavodoxin [Acholeplasmataceae bacterium]MDD4090176.1 flavodoxin [Acholeplasmataceae bacterium]